MKSLLFCVLLTFCSLSLMAAADGRASLLDKLYAKAQHEMRADRLTAPRHSNAYDYFLAMLSLDPQDERALGGIKDIQDRYIALMTHAAERGDYDAARNTFNRAMQIFPGNAKLKKAGKKVLRLQRRVQKDWAIEVAKHELSVFKLPSWLLKKNSAKSDAFFLAASQRLARTSEQVLITAKTDAQGRWIYKKLKTYAQGFRVRGDIRIGKAVSLEFLPPINY